MYGAHYLQTHISGKSVFKRLSSTEDRVFQNRKDFWFISEKWQVHLQMSAQLSLEPMLWTSLGDKTDSPPRIIFAIHEIPRAFNTQQGSHHPLLPKESLIPAKICLTALNCSHFGGEVPKAFKIKERNVFYIIFLRHSCLERVEKHGHMHTKPPYRNKDILSHRVGLADRCFF